MWQAGSVPCGLGERGEELLDSAVGSAAAGTDRTEKPRRTMRSTLGEGVRRLARIGPRDNNPDIRDA